MAEPLASKSPVNVVTPVTPNVPPTVALLSTCKPKPVDLLNVTVSDAFRVPLIWPLVAVNAANVVAPVTPNVSPIFTVVKAPVLALVEPTAPSNFALIVPTEPENTALLLDEPPSLASGI